jgi:hypothetical protein
MVAGRAIRTFQGQYDSVREETMIATSKRGLMIACILIGVPAFAATDEKGFVRIAPDEILWKDIPNGHGAQLATLQGDSTKPGIYVQRGRMSAANFVEAA